jgi:hypothetical protein
MDSAPKIRVVVRKRPLTKKEVARTDSDIVRMSDDQSLSVEEIK